MGPRRGSLGELIGIGISAALCLAAGVGGGYWVGEATGAGTVSTLVGLCVGVAAAVAVMYLTIKRNL